MEAKDVNYPSEFFTIKRKPKVTIELFNVDLVELRKLVIGSIVNSNLSINIDCYGVFISGPD